MYLRLHRTVLRDPTVCSSSTYAIRLRYEANRRQKKTTNGKQVIFSNHINLTFGDVQTLTLLPSFKAMTIDKILYLQGV